MSNTSKSIYDFDCVDMYGKPLALSQFIGRPMVVANTASLCGYSYQLKQLEEIWQREKDKGLVVLGVPSNDFGRQEPGNSSEIASLCLNKFGATFPFLSKTPVRGEDAHPLFQWLTLEGGFLSKPRWNFYKYIVGRDGHLRSWFVTITNPSAARFDGALKRAISEAPHRA